MAITIDSANAGTFSNSATVSYNHTVGSGSNVILLALIGWQDNTSNPSVTACSYGGTGMTQLSGAAVTPGSNGFFGCDIWYMLAPPSGTASLSVTIGPTSALDVLGISGISLFGVAQTSTFGTPATATGSAGLVTVTAGGFIAGDFVVSAAGARPFTTMTSGNTQIAQQGGSGAPDQLASYDTTTGIISWTGHNNFSGQNWAISGVVVNPATGGGFTAVNRRSLGARVGSRSYY